MPRVRLVLVAFIFLLCALRAVCAFADPRFPGLSDSWVRFLEIERERNVHLSVAKPLTAEELKLTQILQFDLPRSELQGKNFDVRIEASKALSPAERQFFFSTENTISYFVHATSKKEVAELTRRFGPPTRSLHATRVSGRVTRLVWDPAKKSDPFFLKMDLYPHQQLTGGISSNDLVDEVSQGRIRKLAEKLAVRIKIPGFSNTYMYRSAEEISDSFRRGKELYPLHGFLGSNLIDQAAQASGLSRAEWIQQEYLPKLAGRLASNHFRDGIHFTAHTQNSMIEIDPKTGKIVDFVFKDLQDTMVDKLVLEQNGGLSAFDSKKIDRILNQSFHDEGALIKKRGMEPGMHFALYDAQSIYALTKDREAWKAYSGIFLKEYLKKVSEIRGHPVSLTPENRALLERLVDARNLSGVSESRELNDTQSALVRILNDAYEDTSRQLVPRLNPENFDYDQYKLKVIFKEEAERGRLLKIVPKIGFDASYAFDGKRIYAVDPESHKILAMTEHLETPELSWAASLSGRKPPGALSKVIGCAVKFTKLLNR